MILRTIAEYINVKYMDMTKRCNRGISRLRSDNFLFSKWQAIEVKSIKDIVIKADCEEIVIKASRNNEDISLGCYGNNFLNTIESVVSCDNGTLFISSHCEKDVMLIIILPLMLFERVRVCNQIGSISISKDVMARELSLETVNGKISSRGYFKKLRATAINDGDVDIHIFAKEDIDMDVVTKHGNIKMCLSNNAFYDIHHHTKGKSFYDFHRKDSGYCASGYVMTEYGKIWLL